MTTVNNLFAHSIKETNIKRYGDNLQFLSPGNSTDICRYSGYAKAHA